jgi:MSHA biogenesis protein MshJ
MIRRYWQTIATRIDALALRQRAMLFATLSLAVVAMAYVSLLDPVLIRQKALIDKAKRDQSQLTAVRTQIESMLRQEGKDPEQNALRDLEKRAAEAEQALADKKQGFAASTRLPALLKDLLGKGVRLESLKVLPGTQVEGGSQLYRHGVELTLRGRYFDLLQYLSDLEALPLSLLWGSGELQVEDYPEVKLTLQIHTLNPHRALGL